jgi:hypothetical protein
MIYYHRYVDIPVLSIKDDVIWISLDRRITKAIIKMVKHLISLNVKFFFSTRIIIHNKQLYKEDLQSIIQSYLLALTDENFFDPIFDSGFDYIENLTDFMTQYDCHELFKEPYENVKKIYLREITDWYLNKTYFKIKKEYIRDFIRTLEREIKLNMFL